MNIHRTNDLLRTASENITNEERLADYLDKRVSEDYQRMLDEDPSYLKWCDQYGENNEYNS